MPSPPAAGAQRTRTKRNIPCVRIDGTIRGKARKEALERVRAGGPLLVMTTPETLGSAEASEARHGSGGIYYGRSTREFALRDVSLLAAVQPPGRGAR